MVLFNWGSHCWHRLDAAKPNEAFISDFGSVGSNVFYLDDDLRYVLTILDTTNYLPDNQQKT